MTQRSLINTSMNRYIYHHEITKNFASNNTVLKSYISSPMCGMKFLQHQMDYARSKENHESSSDSSEHHTCMHEDLYHPNVTNDDFENEINMEL